MGAEAETAAEEDMARRGERETAGEERGVGVVVREGRVERERAVKMGVMSVGLIDLVADLVKGRRSMWVWGKL